MIIKMVDLYSYWMTAHFILYKLFENRIPSWMSPFPALFIGFFIQLYIFYRGRNTLKLSFIIAVLIWKLSMLIFTKITFDIKAILFNLLIFGIYLVFISKKGISLKDLYTNAIYKTEHEHKTLTDFVKFRLNNIY